jgi:hypothetical protein
VFEGAMCSFRFHPMGWEVWPYSSFPWFLDLIVRSLSQIDDIRRELLIDAGYDSRLRVGGVGEFVF